MKKAPILFSVFLAFGFGVSGVSRAGEVQGVGLMDARYEKLNQEAERNKELLEIWKDHVRTLTKERDEAYKELEQLKSGSPNRSQFGAIETQPLPGAPSPGAIRDLQSQIQSLAAENERSRQAADDLRSQLRSLRGPAATDTADELRQLRQDKDRLLQNLEDANRQLEVLRSEAARNQDEPQKLQALESELAKMRQDKEAFLKTNAEMGVSYQAAMKASEESRRRAESAEAENKKLKDVQAGLQSEIDRLRSDNQRIASLSGELDKTKRDLEAARRASADLERQNEDLRRSVKAQLEAMASSFDTKR
ncbi:MAG: hypothetical protein HYZ52_03755 [Candidatus Omnitrophica bacterium]|nr:hypothetical protein [Candidatus Omnitrophota bacterium]